MTDNNRKQTTFFLLGVLLTFIIALVAGWLAKVPYLDVVGQLVLAIIIGIIWNHTIGLKDAYRTGVSFSSKKIAAAWDYITRASFKLNRHLRCRYHCFFVRGIVTRANARYRIWISKIV